MAWDDNKQVKDDILSAEYNSMVSDQKSRAFLHSPEEYTGGDCTLTDGDANRVLTLSNSRLTEEMLVFVNGLAELPSNMSITHNNSGSTIEFNKKLWDSDTIQVMYFS